MQPNVISFGHAPQATGDVFDFSALDTDNDGTVRLDVLSNDLGRPTLYSLDDGVSAGGTSPTDLLTRDAIGYVDHSLHGAAISIGADGKVGYSFTADLKAYTDQYGSDQTVLDSFNYAEQMGNNGTLAWAHADVVLHGTHQDSELLHNWSFEEGQQTSGGAWQVVNPVPGWTIAPDSKPIEVVSAGYAGTGGDGHFVDGEASPGGIHLIQLADVITGHGAVLGISLAAQNVGGQVTDPGQVVHVAFNGTDVLAISGAQILADAGAYGVFHTYSTNVVGAAGVDQVDIQVTGQPGNVGPAIDWVSLHG